MRILRGAGGALIQFVGYVLTIVTNSSGYLTINGKVIYALTTAISVGDAIPGAAAVAGSLAFTTHATGRGQIFISDGTYWQDYFAVVVQYVSATVPTSAGNTDVFVEVPYTGKLLGAGWKSTDGLATDNTNYATASITNLGADGSGSTAMLAATDPNTTKTTGGAAIVANTRRAWTLHGTAGNLAVTQFHRLRLRIAGAGTLANTLTNGVWTLVFQRS